jgi:hypothetical protein
MEGNLIGTRQVKEVSRVMPVWSTGVGPAPNGPGDYLVLSLGIMPEKALLLRPAGSIRLAHNKNQETLRVS